MTTAIETRNTRLDIRDCKTSKEVLEKTGLGFQVKLHDAFFLDAKGKPVKANTGHRVVVREDTGHALAIVGSRYVPIQSDDFIGRLDAVVKKGDLKYVSASVFDHGRVMVVEAQLPKPIVLKAPNGKDDVMLRRVLWKNAHDGTQQISLADYLLRQWCTNGATEILGMSSYAVRHTASADSKISVASHAVASSVERFATVERTAQRLLETPFSVKQMETVAAKMYPAKDEDDVAMRTVTARAELVELFTKGTGTFGRTAWDAVNALTEWGTHKRKVRDADQRELSRLRSTWLNNTQVVAGYHLVLDEAGVAEVVS